ncbi:TIGR03862 family flavoprotein [Phaeobacter sp.]|uniref:TIGR03862 family flavoprotein n=1 Tax=Phaeobacter sp. TaxID=1902409 RepID=UPI0025D1025F|nr:TIGR03862 family flavoprotein [Phaeobacter sp.]
MTGQNDRVWDAVIVGAGPAGLRAAEELGAAGHTVLIADAKPSVARKFLMAGKSGLNLTKDEPLADLLQNYGDRADWLSPMLSDCASQEIQDWARGLGVTLFSGSTGRVFPIEMKASPMLRAWLARLDAYGVERRTRWCWQGWEQDHLRFETPEGSQLVRARAVVLAMGGASWARLGSDGKWAAILAAQDVALAPFRPSNVGLKVAWSEFMRPYLGTPLKGIALSAGASRSRGEAVISESGLEGGGIYAVCAAVRDGADLAIDLFPDLSPQQITERLSRSRGKASLSSHMRKTLKLAGGRLALLQEFCRPLPQDPAALAALVKAVPVRHAGLQPIDQAISTAGGVCAEALDDMLMLRARPGVFCAGEMLDWEAPTGGYLLTASIASGRWAGRGAATYLKDLS